MLELRVLGRMELSGGEDTDLDSILRRPKRLAILAYLCIADPGSLIRRDTLIALFWPESDEDHARAALNQSLYVLRSALGSQAVIGRGREEVGIDRSLLGCDACAFRDALETDDLQRALDLYAGELLPGLHIDCPDFERWLASERASLREDAHAAALELGTRAAGAGAAAEATEFYRRALEIAPESALAARHLVEDSVARRSQTCGDRGIRPIRREPRKRVRGGARERAAGADRPGAGGRPIARGRLHGRSSTLTGVLGLRAGGTGQTRGRRDELDDQVRVDPGRPSVRARRCNDRSARNVVRAVGGEGEPRRVRGEPGLPAGLGRMGIASGRQCAFLPRAGRQERFDARTCVGAAGIRRPAAGHVEGRAGRWGDSCSASSGGTGDRARLDAPGRVAYARDDRVGDVGLGGGSQGVSPNPRPSEPGYLGSPQSSRSQRPAGRSRPVR